MDKDIMLKKPLEAIRSLYQRAGCPLEISAGDWGVVDAFREVLSHADGLAQIPYVTDRNMDLLPQNSLVRFRGMVQDMPNPEYYMGALQCPDGTWVSSKYQDLTGPCVEQCLDSRIWERRPLFCVPPPGESTWSCDLRPTAVHVTTGSSDGVRGSKRGRQDSGQGNEQDVQAMDSDLTAVPVASGAAPETDAPRSIKSSRMHDEDDVAQGDKTAGMKDTAGGKVAARQAGGSFVFLYDQAGQDCVLHDVVDVVGVLSRCPELAALQMDSGAADDEWAMADTRALADQLPPPTSQAIRIHALVIQRCSSVPPAPSAAAGAAPSSTPSPAVVSPALADSEQVQRLRRVALKVLAHALGGDALAAEFLLMQLLARVVSRGGTAGGSDPVGMAPLSFTGCPVSPAPTATAAATAGPLPASGASAAPVADAAESASGQGGDAMAVDGNVSGTAAAPACPPPSQRTAPRQPPPASSFAAALVAAAAALVPFVSCLPISVEGLNAGGGCPDGGRLAPTSVSAGSGGISHSPLQLPPGSLLVLDETVMTEGQLQDQGVRNLQDLLSVVRDQQLLYDFGFHQQPVPVNLPVVVLSGPRSIMRDHLPVQVPLNPTAAWVDADAVQQACSSTAFLGEPAASDAASVVTQVRQYLMAAAMQPYMLGEAISSVLQAEFVSKRKADSTYGPEQFSVLLTLGRLAALSFGESSMSERTWRHVQALEATREARLRVM